MVFMMNSQILEHENRSTEREYFIYYILLCKLTTFLYWVPHFVQKCHVGPHVRPEGPRRAPRNGTPARRGRRDHRDRRRRWFGFGKDLLGTL